MPAMIGGKHHDIVDAKRVEMRGGATLEEVAEVIGVVRERIRQIEDRALAKLRGEALPIAEDLDD